MTMLAAGCGRSGDPDPVPGPLADFYEQEVSWRSCERGAFECATIAVPLDYDEPDGERLDIAVMRLPASGADRIGSLVINPGGPGGSGLDYARAAGRVISDQIRERFDIVGFDPRGVGKSDPLHCLDRPDLDDYLGGGRQSEAGADPADLTPDEVDELAEDNEEFAEACERRSGNLLEHVRTENVARDMDVLRAVLGDEKLTYLGKSYGTFIGAMYAQQFPERVRAVVLDGALDPSLNGLEMSVQQARGFHTALRAFVADCLERSDCPLSDGAGSTVDEGVERLSELLDRAGEQPLRSTLGDGREVTRARVQMGLLAALYSDAYWPEVRSALNDAFEDGDGTGLLRLGDRLYGREGRNYENMTAALVSVNCADHESPRDIGTYQAAAEQAAEDSPIFGPSLAWSALPCAFWPEHAVAPTMQITAAGAPPILVVGTTRDSATPYEWSKSLARQLESGVLLTRDGDGHTGYRMGNACVDQAVDTYLLRAEPPRNGTVCQAA
ncbi:peptidase S33 family protein [Marinitenerispora sediminis]|uniref:Peptidase S33 family protein n=2 Tax=Marinitenerispora sediminis TaxID=1931232 RepID=A0A368T8A2_9ACTN|nr:peptidase S33 family protein [Marinitenerispora sediminis]RCV57225.1 peptidase S33 family protein [Marinitenerispora sediminis]RCV58579.1 peptidase S33 family protein [Marinitenerispora sediminis]